MSEKLKPGEVMKIATVTCLPEGNTLITFHHTGTLSQVIRPGESYVIEISYTPTPS